MVNRQALDVEVSIGTDPASLTPAVFASDAQGGTVIEDTLGALSADTDYFYRIRYRRARHTSDADYRTYQLSPGDSVFRFHTKRAAGETFVVTLEADSHGGGRVDGSASDTSLYAVALANILADSADLHFTLGDHVKGRASECSTYAEIYADNLILRDRMSHVLVQTPFCFVLGNHEDEKGWIMTDADSNGVWSTQARMALWPNPQDDGAYENYYSFEWGDALFVVLDPYRYTTSDPQEIGAVDGWRWTLGKTQYDWLYDTLHASTATWKIVLTHQLVGGAVPTGYGRGGTEWAGYFEWGGNDTADADVFSTKRSGWTHDPIHDMAVAEGVDLFVFGHDHVYVYQTLDDIVYLHVPKVSDSGYGDGAASVYTDESNVMYNNAGHIRMTVNPDSLVVQYVRAVLSADEPLVENGDSIYNQTVSHRFTLTAE